MDIRTISMTIAISLGVATVAFSQSPKTWRVGAKGDFPSLQAAHDSAEVQPGDVLNLDGSNSSYGDLTASKRLIIYGPGYFLDQNVDTQVIKAPSNVGTLTFNPGSEGSIVAGLRFQGGLHINASGITIMRNLFQFGACCYEISIAASNCNIQQNYIETHAIAVIGGCSDIVLEKNLIGKSGFAGARISSPVSCPIAVTNNVIIGPVDIGDGLLLNNILRDHGLAPYEITGNFSAYNNVSSTSPVQFLSGTGNQAEVDMATVFVGTGSTDGQWQLKEGSPAIGAGKNGEDCGMFGGPEPYVLSGLPPIPAVYEINMPGVTAANQTIPVTVKVKSH